MSSTSRILSRDLLRRQVPGGYGVETTQLKMFYRIVENIIDFYMFFYSFTCKNYPQIYNNL